MSGNPNASYCGKCGAKNPPHSVNCERCGAPLVAADSTDDALRASVSSDLDQEELAQDLDEVPTADSGRNVFSRQDPSV